MQLKTAIFLPMIVKWVVGEHPQLKIENGVGEDERGGGVEQGIRSMPPSKAACMKNSTGDDVGLRSLFLPMEVKERERKSPFF